MKYSHLHLDDFEKQNKRKQKKIQSSPWNLISSKTDSLHKINSWLIAEIDNLQHQFKKNGG